MGSDSCGVNLGQDFDVSSPFCSCHFLHQAHFLRALLCMVMIWGDQVSFLSTFTPRYVGGILLVDFLFTGLQNELFSLGDREKQVASVLVLLIIANHSFAQSEMRFIASCILMAVMVTCSALVNSTRSSACSACGMCEDSCSQMSSMKIMKRVGKMNPTLWDSFSDLH